ncbi:MAG: exopolysaccharide biosynthesis polyprenyl glycosylphosphotransferase [Terracidiphilus sp.]
MAAPDLFASNLYVETVAPPRAARRTVSRQFFRAAMAFAEIAADFTACVAGTIAAYACTALAIISSSVPGALRSAAPLGAAFGLIVVVLFYRDGAYRKSRGLLQIRETERAVRVPAQALFLLLSIRSLLGLGVSWLQSLVALFAVSMLMILEKQFFSWIARRLHKWQNCSVRTVIYGASELGRRAISNLLQTPRIGLDPVAVIDEPASTGSHILEMGYRGRRSIPVVHRRLTASLLKAHQCEMLLLAASGLSANELAAAAYVAHQAGADVAWLRDLRPSDEPSGETIDLDGTVFVTSRECPGRWLYLIFKRIADILISSLLIVLLAPLLALIAILVRLDSPGPAFFVQERVGRNGELFGMFKLRSMFIGAPRYARSPSTSSDPRITRIGRVLRRLSLDELPQLFNVLMGTMSLVGPRPEMPFIVEHYGARQRTRLQVKPGITGLWQLSADRGFPIHQNIEYDLYYIRNRTFAMDAAILVHTLIFALCGGI